MVQPPTPTPPVRLGKGHKRGTKQEAVVSGLYTITPDPRSPQAVVAALWQDPDGPESATRSHPGGQARRATLAGKAAALSCLAPRAAPRDGPPSQSHVARTEGAEARPQQMGPSFPAYRLMLDIRHATA